MMPFESYRQLKFPTYKKPFWRTAAILQNQETAITPERFDRLARKFHTLEPHQQTEF